MFKCDELIYLQMQKTGCTHIASLLHKIFEGEEFDKHKPAKPEQLTSTQHVFSSIRNPWDWYLSLWTFGVQGGGTLMRRLTKSELNNPINSINNNPKKFLGTLINKSSSNINTWRAVYDRSDNVNSFRKWLRLIHDPNNSNYLGEGYGKTTIPDFCGFMTYRYLKLCCSNLDKLKKPGQISNLNELIKFDKNNCLVEYFIRQEDLENSLCQGLELVRPLTQLEKDLIYGSKKTNTSKRALTTTDYYDEESIELVRNRDRLIIDKFNYPDP